MRRILSTPTPSISKTGKLSEIVPGAPATGSRVDPEISLTLAHDVQASVVIAEETQLPSMAVSAAQLDESGGDVALNLSAGEGVQSLFLRRQGTVKEVSAAVGAGQEPPREVAAALDEQQAETAAAGSVVVMAEETLLPS